ERSISNQHSLSFICYCTGDHRDLHSFPTRRSSDLNIYGLSSITRIGAAKYSDGKVGGINLDTTDRFALDGQRLLLKSGIYGDDRSEEHTSELQSRENLVCRLLLEKKKKKK